MVLCATVAKMVYFAVLVWTGVSVTENHGVAGSIPALGTIKHSNTNDLTSEPAGVVSAPVPLVPVWYQRDRS